MSRVVPSQVVHLIEHIFPKVNNPTNNQISIESVYSASLAGIIDLVEQIPNELILLSGDDYTGFVLSINAIKTALKKWESKPGQTLKKIPGYKRGENNYERDPVWLLRKTLSLCPDEFPSPETAELLFITYEDFRENLRIDISAVNSALSNGEWKAATVIAGSVIEALLLYKLKEKSNNENLNKCSLDELINKAQEKRIIKNNTVKQAKLAKDFRNLIHPGREIRKKQKCDRGTALAAVAAVELVVRDLKENL